MGIEVGTTAPADTGEYTIPPQWFVIRTQPQAESVAACELARDGFEVFAPRVTSVRAKAGTGETPLFPGYLFLRCAPAEAGQHFFRSGHRIAGWVNFGGAVPPVPDEVISELQQRVASIERDGGLWRRYQQGEKVWVVANGLESLAEVVEGAKSPQARVKIMLEFMGRLVPGKVPWDNLRPVDNQVGEDTRLTRRTRGSGRWIRGRGPRAAGTTPT